MSEVAVRLAPERSPAKDQLVGADSKRPPINGVRVSTLSKNLWRHVCHRTRYTGQQTPLGIVDGDVEVGDVSMATLVQKDVVRLQVTVRMLNRSAGIMYLNGYSPMDDTVVVEICERRPNFCDVVPHDLLRK